MSKNKLLIISKVINRGCVFLAIGSVIFSMSRSYENTTIWNLALFALALAAGTGLVELLLSHPKTDLSSKQIAIILAGGAILSIIAACVIFIFNGF